MREDLPKCEHLHLLQMACEKLGKAYRCRGGTPPSALRTSHAYVAKVLPQIVAEYAAWATKRPPVHRSRWMSSVRQLAGEIEVLAPSVEREGSREDNCEYPWRNGTGAVHAPCDEAFGGVIGLLADIGPIFHKVLRVAATDLAQ